MRVALAAEPQSVACTFCESRVPVPSLEQARSELAAKGPLPVPTVEEYAIADPAGGARPRPAARFARSGAAAGATVNQAAMISLECPTCHEPIRTQAGATPGRMPCPFCGGMVSVPDRRSVAGWQSREVAPRSREEIGEYAAGAPVETPSLRPGNVFDRLAEIRREVAPPPPRWTFFSGVFNFPSRQDAHLRWLYMTVGFTALAVMGLVVKGIVSSFSGIGSGVALAFFLLPIIWVSFLTLSFTAACCLCVLESTAAGLDRVEGWPDPQWKEWMAQLIYVGWVGAVPLAVSYGLATLASLAGAQVEQALPCIFFVLYPIALLSALEANSIWVPLTVPVLVGLVRWWWAWLTFYLLAGLLAAGLAAVFLYSVTSSQDLLQLLLGPLVAAAALIYFRLLGRLAWRMTTKSR
jgi:hypothetical protein